MHRKPATALRVRTGRVADYMREAGITTAAALAELMGVDPATVSRMFAGRNIELSTLARLYTVFPDKRLLGDLVELVDGDDNPEATVA